MMPGAGGGPGFGGGGYPQGYGPPPGGFGYGGLPPLPPPAPGGIARFAKHMAVGAVLGGVLSAIPLLNLLNCCFCLLNVGGVTVGLALYLSAHPEEYISAGDAALFGVVSGAGSGLIAGTVGLVLNIALRGVMEGLSGTLPPQLAQSMTQQGAMGAIAIPFDAVLYAGFGALGAFLAMQLFFKARLRA